MREALVGAAAALLLGAALPAAAAAPDFAYDASSTPKLAVGAERSPAAGVTARDVTFTSVGGRLVKGELITGSANGPHPGVLFVHWLGDPKTTNHTEFEPDAIALAKDIGATSLLVDAMWAAPGWFDTVGKSADDDARVTVNQVVDLRRSLDVLAAQPGVDPARIAYVAHDFGAMMGALLAGVDARPSWYVLMAGTQSLSEWYLLGKTAPGGYAARFDRDFDLLGPLGRVKAKGLLFQFAAKDHYIPADRAQAFLAAAPLPKGAFWYDTDHALAIAAAFSDRQAWLKDKLTTTELTIVSGGKHSP